MVFCEHYTVWRESGRYGGWPANYGIWSWGDEIVVGFLQCRLDASVKGHKRDRSSPATTMLARSTDGGVTWKASPFCGRTPGARALCGDEHQDEGLRAGEHLDGQEAPVTFDGELDFTHPEFALMCARSGLGPGTRAWFYTSTDRCHTWAGPYWLPMFDLDCVAARTDYLIDGPKQATLFLTTVKVAGREGRVFCARTTDGARSFDFLSFVGPEPEGYSIMPASIRLSASRVVCAVRRREGGGPDPARGFIELFASDDNCASWKYVCEPVVHTGAGSNPPAMVRLPDGRLFLAYGFRDTPPGIHATVSEDEGRTWSDPIVLRDDGGDWDIGYPRAAVRADGKVVVCYYYDTEADGERFIGASVVSP
jgi:hypothetical protein